MLISCREPPRGQVYAAERISTDKRGQGSTSYAKRFQNTPIPPIFVLKSIFYCYIFLYSMLFFSKSKKSIIVDATLQEVVGNPPCKTLFADVSKNVKILEKGVYFNFTIIRAV